MYSFSSQIIGFVWLRSVHSIKMVKNVYLLLQGGESPALIASYIYYLERFLVLSVGPFGFASTWTWWYPTFLWKRFLFVTLWHHFLTTLSQSDISFYYILFYIITSLSLLDSGGWVSLFTDIRTQLKKRRRRRCICIISKIQKLHGWASEPASRSQPV